MAEKENKKPVTDVEKPGTTPAGATSRPIIITKGPAIKDPMVNEAKPEDEEQPTSARLPSAKKKTIQPLTEQPEPVAQPDISSQTEELPTESELAANEEKTKSEAAEAAQKLSEEELKRQELVDKLVAEKKYFVPIGAVQKKRTTRTASLLFIVIVLIIGGALLSVDAELIQTDIKLPFDLIK